ncbi:uncharacterized protein Dwil_GK10352 [Drosophila willistoni]|uniref:Thioredoxin domain-containing protein 17 n=1 Tax=Drosophila willistoni TaxID=7260 RepID=B4MJA3_DROWI|nr:thioredoxin domain-containing protein 17 [Drosophila willistoni]EDW72192.1 uncharacterized protein Dwil_GK10352 [Drosophila willistoni]
MPKYVPARGYKELDSLLQRYNGQKEVVYIYFYGEKDSKGVSWCSDCVEAESTITKGFTQLASDDAVVVQVDVGNREAWKDLNNDFRKPPLNISVIPTLIRWNGVERLEGDHLRNISLLELFFEETTQNNSSATKP